MISNALSCILLGTHFSYYRCCRQDDLTVHAWVGDLSCSTTMSHTDPVCWDGLTVILNDKITVKWTREKKDKENDSGVLDHLLSWKSCDTPSPLCSLPPSMEHALVAGSGTWLRKLPSLSNCKSDWECSVPLHAYQKGEMERNQKINI